MDLINNNISRYVQEEYANIFGFDIGCHEAIIICIMNNFLITFIQWNKLYLSLSVNTLSNSCITVS